MREDRCRDCNRRIFWALSPNGKRTPYEQVPTLYEIKDGVATSVKVYSGAAFLEQSQLVEKYPNSMLFISHFTTCPAAGKWSGATRKARSTFR